MKKQILKKLMFHFCGLLIVLLVVNFVIQLMEARRQFQIEAKATLAQVQNTLTSNETEIKMLMENLIASYELQADAVAYIVQRTNIAGAKEFRDVAELQDIDEIHLFNNEGVIYDGSHPEYYGISVYDGEQIGFFRPMLDDKNLKLTQDITPNTAEEKSMIYVATWTEDKSVLVQIGLQPERIIEAQEKNKLSNIFATILREYETTLFAVDKDNHTVLGTTDIKYLNQDAVELGILHPGYISMDNYITEIEGEKYICLVREWGDIYIVEAKELSTIWSEVFHSMNLVCAYLLISGGIVLIIVIRIFDRKVLRSMKKLVEDFNSIASGDLDKKVSVTSSPEFASLSHDVNLMVKALLDTTARLSFILDKADIKMAVFEYRHTRKRVIATSKIHTLLGMTKGAAELLLEDSKLFELRINEIQKNVIDEKNHFYKVKSEERYLCIYIEQSGDESYGIIVDVTDTLAQQRKIEYERDHDLLTGMYNRRAFRRKMQFAFEEQKGKLKCAAFFMFDMDNLKFINDNYGHPGGDLAIQKMAEIFKDITTEHKIAARLGGDEFIVCIYGEESIDAIEEYIAKIKEKASNAWIEVENQSVQVKFSGGYSYCTGGYDYDQLLKEADEALYQAKRSGKAQFCRHNKESF